ESQSPFNPNPSPLRLRYEDTGHRLLPPPARPRMSGHFQHKGILMRRILPVMALFLAWAGSARAHGILIPVEKKLPPLAMLDHHVTITIDNQVATTRVEQTFRNHTDRQLEATYIFPVPKGAGVDKFTMWVNGKEVKGELLPATQAREIYTSFVRRTQDPGLLEY